MNILFLILSVNEGATFLTPQSFAVFPGQNKVGPIRLAFIRGYRHPAPQISTIFCKRKLFSPHLFPSLSFGGNIFGQEGFWIGLRRFHSHFTEEGM